MTTGAKANPGVIQGLIDAATPGGTVSVQAGAYTENIIINKRIVLEGAGKIEKANEELAKGDTRVLDGKFVDAIEHYRNAWKHAIEAV